MTEPRTTNGTFLRNGLLAMGYDEDSANEAITAIEQEAASPDRAGHQHPCEQCDTTIDYWVRRAQEAETQVRIRDAALAATGDSEGPLDVTGWDEERLGRVVWSAVYHSMRSEGVADDHSMARADVVRIEFEKAARLSSKEPDHD